MEDYRLDQSGQEVQDILNGAAMQVDLTAETERATEAEQTLQGNIDAEATRAQGAEGTLQDNIDAEEARAKAAEKQNADDIDAIEEKIPSGASSSNKLATEEYVADAVATATATFRGTYNLVSDLHLTVNATEQQIAAALAGAISTADNNDYCFILVPTSSETPTEIKEIDRYKFNGTAWAFEYKLNNSGFTAAQWAAINSGITSGDVTKLSALPTNAQLTTLLAGLQADIDGEETRAKAAELAIQGNIDAEEVRAKAAEKQNADDIDAIEAVLPESASSENKVATESEINSLSAAIEAILLLIPSAATSLNKLADKAFVNSSIATATATFRGTYNLVNDLGLTTSATHAQIATALAGAILTADNNDYAFVQIPTSDAMPTEIAKTERYKFNGTAWEYEYDLNNSGFTADQWAAINSGITQALVTKLSDLPTNAELTTELGTLTSGITAINQKIPNAASQANKLVDTAAMESYIVEVLNVLTISYNVTSTDGHVTVHIEQVDGKITSVTLTTSDIASAADLNLKASQADLTALASRVTTAEGNITSLGGRMTTAEGNITSLGGRMTTAESNITSLGGRVSTNETDIANLQQLYNDLQQSKPEPVTALPSTGQQQGVIYRLAGTTSYSDYMWNGSTWVLMATYNNAIDPRPKKASQNLVTSGGVFDNMGALDVSELNATENPHTLAKYVDLSAALAAIPTDYQKGGMSIKYVCSSDNKYVQWRLISDTFNTSISNWQGVDDEPTTGSNNLVKSGGVYETLYGKTTISPTYAQTGHFVMVNGTIGDSIPYVITNPIQLLKGQTIEVNAECVTFGSLISLTDVNSSYYSNLKAGLGTKGKVSYTATNDCYVASSYNTENDVEIVITSNNGIVNIIYNCLDGTATPITSTYAQTGYYILLDGTVRASIPYVITNPIQLLKGQTIKVDAECVVWGSLIALTDINSSYYSNLVAGLGEKGEVLYTATESCYVALSYNTESSTTIEIYSYLGVIDLNKRLLNIETNLEDEISELSTKIDNKVLATNIITAFDHIISVGDSLTYSQVYTSATASRRAYNPWPKCVKKICGLDSHNIFAISGGTSKSIWNAYKDSFAVPSQGKSLVTIYLGTNNWFEDTIETSAPAADVENYRTAWADDYTGCMCKIIQTFINLGAKIVLIRPWEGGVFPQNEIPEGWTLADTNEVIRKIALRFNIPYIDSSSINSEAAKYHYWPNLQGSNSLHYNDLGYAYFADAFIKEIGNMDSNFVKLLIPV